MKQYIIKAAVLLLLGILLTGCGKHEYKAGVEKLEAGEYEEAIEKFEAAVEKEQNIGDSCRGIGLAKWELGDYEGASAAFEKALANGSSETGTIYNLLGACKMQLEDFAAAVDYYEKGLQQEDVTAEMAQEMKFNIIAAYESLGNWEEAKEALTEYTAQYPDDAQAAKEAEFLETRQQE